MPRKAVKPKKRLQRRILNKKTAFLAALAITADITASAAAVGMDKSNHFAWLKKDARYAARFAEAKKRGEDALEDEATHRGRVGVYEPNVYKGRFCYPEETYEIEPAIPETLDKNGKIRTFAVPALLGVRNVPGAPPIGTWKKSDFLLAMRLRAAKPEYRASQPSQK